MKRPSFEEFMQTQRTGTISRQQADEKFYIERCPTPGCNCAEVRPIRDRGIITGFTCEYGCTYRAKRNNLTGKIDYYSLYSYNSYRIRNDVKNYRVTQFGMKHIDWV
jgi:hypothetical protein